jgi:RHS repeat-associated protein
MTREDGTFWDYAYDPLGQLTNATRHLPPAEPLSGYQFGYAYDDIGNRLTSTANGQVSTYTPDNANLNQYASRTVPGVADLLGSADPAAHVTVNNQPTARQDMYWHAQMEVDNAGSDVYEEFQIVGVLNDDNNERSGQDAVATDSRSAYVPAASQIFTYDVDGNLTSDGKWTYTWDAENRLVQMETASPALSAVAPRRITFAYDDLGRLRGRHVYDLDTSTTISRHCHVYDAWNLIGELDESSTLVRSYAWGLDLSDSEHGAGGVGGVLLVRAGTDTCYTTYDGNGNVTGLVDPSDGSTPAIYEYDPFGNLLRATGLMAKSNPFRFSTKYQDGETGLVYYGYRWLDPVLGRWSSRDPIEEEGGLNIYAFVDNQPSGAVDTDGRFIVIISPLPPRDIPDFGLPPPGETTRYAGPDISAALATTMAHVNATFWRINNRDTKSMQACCAIMTMEMGDGWDIYELKELGYGTTPLWPDAKFGKHHGEYTVTAREHVYYASAVNYALWGRMFRLCRERTRVEAFFNLATAKSIAAGYKWALQAGEQTYEALAWVEWGYNGADPRQSALSRGEPWEHAPGNVAPFRRFAWKWLYLHDDGGMFSAGM